MAIETVDLDIIVRYVPDDDDDLEKWRRSFQRASELLYHATDAQMQFGTLFVSIDTPSDAGTDAFLYEEDPGESFAIFQDAMYLYHDEQREPLVIVHEFGHFCFDLGDEYGGGCTGHPSQKACIMEFSDEGDRIDDVGTLTLGQVYEFCSPDTPGQHQPGNVQHILHQESCWETIQDNDEYPSFVIPASGREIGSKSLAGHVPINWIKLVSEFRYVLILDNSKSVANSAFTDGQKIGAQFWVDLVTGTLDPLALVSSSGNKLFSLDKVDSPDKIAEAFKVIDNLEFGETSNHHQALNEASSQIDSGGAPASVQAVVLITGNSPDEIQPGDDDGQKLRRGGKTVHSIDVGPEAFRQHLEDLARVTRGSLDAIIGSHEDNQIGFALQSKLIELACQLRIGNGPVSTKAALLPPRIDSPDNKRFYRDGQNKLALQPHSEGMDERVLIESGSDQATFVLSAAATNTLQLQLFDPKGDLIQENGGVRYVDRDLYSFYEIEKPIPGAWTLRTMRTDAKDSILVKTFVFSRNPELFVKLNSRQTNPLEIWFSANAFFGELLSNYGPLVVEVFPSQPVEFQTVDQKREQIILKPRQYYDKDTDQWIVLNEFMYEGTVTVGSPGVYTVQARFVNDGTAIRRNPSHNDKTGMSESVPPFVRIVTRQIRVTD